MAVIYDELHEHDANGVARMLARQRRRQPVTLDDLRAGTVTVCRVSDLAAILGLSDQKIRDDIDAGELVVGRRSGDDRRMFLITREAACLYLHRMGVL